MKKQVIPFIFIIIATVIGAGFASGKELVTFFEIYGKFAPIIVIIWGIFFGKSLHLFLNFDSQKLNPKTAKFINIFLLVTEFITIFAMIAGLESIINMLTKNDVIFWILLVFCYFVISQGLKGLTSSSILLLPITIAIILILGIKSLSLGAKISDLQFDAVPLYKYIFYPFLYLGLDIFSCLPLAIEFGSKLSKKQKVTASFGVSTILITLVLSSLLLSLPFENVKNSPMPTLQFSINYAPKLTPFCGIAIAIGILTTLISSGFILQNITKTYIKNNYLSTFIILFSAFVCSKFGFSNIVAYIYPVTGFMGIVFLFITLSSQKTKQSNSILTVLSNKK